MKSHRDFKDQLFAEIERLGRALGNRHRLELLDVLAQGERTVEELSSETAMSVANTSRHLQSLRQAKLVSYRARGPFRYYTLSGPGAFQMWQVIRDQASTQFAEVDRLVQAYIRNTDELAPLGLEELRARIKRDDVVVLDVRPRVEYAAGHIPGARSIPVAELESQLDQLPEGKAVVVYCRGPFCMFSGEAVTMLKSKGVSARRLEQGYPDWEAAGLPVAKSSKRPNSLYQ